MKILVLLFLPFSMWSQVDLDNPPWDIGCDTMETQTDMNICSHESYLIADSAMTILFHSTLAEFETRFNAMTSKESKIQMENEIEMLVKGQELFEAYLEKMKELISEQYKGGSIMPLMRNSMGVRLIEQRIEVLNALHES